MFSIIYEPVHGIIYKNRKKEKRVMRHSEIHKFCDATLNRVLEGLKSYNNDVKYGYIQRDLTNDEVEYLKLFEEDIESGQVPVNDAKQSSSRAATSISTARPVNTAAPKLKVNDALPTPYSYFQAHSPVKKPINKRIAVTDINFNKKFNTAKVNNVTTAGPKAVVSAAEGNRENAGNPQYTLQDQGIFDSGYSRHMTGNKSFLIDYQEIDGEFDAFGTEELKFNLFSVSQMCDKKNSVLFTETECLVLSPDFKLLDESQVLLKVPRQNNMYSFDLKNVVPSGGLTCLFAKATIDKSNLWHRRLGHINFKTMNKLVRGNLVRGLPSKLFENDHTCVACQKGKQHKAFCKTKLDETSGILKTFISGIENQINHKVKIIRCDNGTEFKNNDMNQFCGMKWIKREFSVARTPQQNRVAKIKNMTLIEATSTMLADSLLPTTFWAEAVNRTVTPLFQSMLAIQALEGKGLGQPSEFQPTPPPALPSHEVQVTTIASHPQKTHTPRRAKRGRDTEISQSNGPPKKVGDEAVYTGEDDRVVRAVTTATSLEAELETASKQSCDPPLSKVNTSGSREVVQPDVTAPGVEILAAYDSPSIATYDKRSSTLSNEGHPWLATCCYSGALWGALVISLQKLGVFQIPLDAHLRMVRETIRALH
ncbi:putative ribonuclease H-like domain-containing protein [Tanacetum coccineum]|uniref:Ribonuclease H-like domain-containing protein n=1 Tax=Tanacetum coccineum TaxID=301880 RepID=A0ABQ4WP98_9ASTR